MNKYFFYILAVAFVFAAAFTSCKKDEKPKSVSVGAQSGALTESVAGTVTFPVTTANIGNGSYAAHVANLPAGVTV
jgi:hypothetical protein